jgi:hypothetical protein
MLLSSHNHISMDIIIFTRRIVRNGKGQRRVITLPAVVDRLVKPDTEYKITIEALPEKQP